jgi:hypothetical protein
LAGSRSMETKEGRAVPLLFKTGSVRNKKREGMEAHNFFLDEFIWAVDKLFHLGFPKSSITLEGRSGEPEGEVFD